MWEEKGQQAEGLQEETALTERGYSDAAAGVLDILEGPIRVDSRAFAAPLARKTTVATWRRSQNSQRKILTGNQENDG